MDGVNLRFFVPEIGFSFGEGCDLMQHTNNGGSQLWESVGSNRTMGCGNNVTFLSAILMEMQARKGGTGLGSLYAAKERQHGNMNFYCLSGALGHD